MNHISRSPIARALLLAWLAFLPAPSARAAVYYWDNNGATIGFGTAAGTWAAPTAGNATQGWSTSSDGTLVPGNVTTTTSDDLNFGFAANGLASGTITVSGTVTANSLTIATNSGDITLSGGTIVLGGSGAFLRANQAGQIISSAITLNTNVSIIAGINGNPVLSLNGAIGGTGNVTFTTPAAVNGSSGQTTVINLGAASTYTGTTRITTSDNDNSLTIEAQVANALPRTTVLTLDGGDGAGSGRTVALELNGKSQTIAGLNNITGYTLRNQRILNSAGSATLTISNTSDFTFSGNLNGSGLGLTKTGAGTQTLAAGNSYTGATTLNAGKLRVMTGGHCSNSTAIVNAAAATLGVAVEVNSESWSFAAMTANAAGTLEFDFDPATPSVSNSPLDITGAANFTAATPTVSVLMNAALAAGSYPLITWGSVSGAPPTNVTVSPLAAGTGASLSVVGNTLRLVISNLPPTNMTVRVETKADGTGVLAPAATIADGVTRTNFAIARDSGGVFLGNVAANWYLTNLTGGVVQLDLEPAPDGKSAIFTGGAAGTARVALTAGGTNHVPSGVITVTNTFNSRPFIWVRSWERTGILSKVATNAWAASVYNGMVARVAANLASHQSTRDAWLRQLPVDWTNSPALFKTIPTYTEGSVRGAAESKFNTALDCAVLYYLTQDTNYAQCAADILHNAVKTLLPVAPSTSVGNGGWVFEDDLLKEARILGCQLPVVFDFLYAFLQNNQVYDVQTAGLVNFSIADAQTFFRTYYTLVRDHGQLDSNWSALMSTCMLNSLLALTNTTERTSYLQFYLSTNSARQASLNYDYRHYDNPGDVWPESLQYASAVGNIRTFHLALIERYDPARNLFTNYPNFAQSLPRIPQLRYPNGTMQISFGDGHRDASGQSFLLYEKVYQHARARGYSNLVAQFGGLIKGGTAAGEYNRATLDAYDSLGSHNEPLQLLWHAPTIPEAGVALQMPRTDALPWAGIALQRVPSTVSNAIFGLMCFVGGAGHVHSHASGMSMELYGLGQVLGAKSGVDDYAADITDKYYRLFAANNTVIVNGASRGENGWNGLAINTVATVAIEPQPFAAAVSSNFSFSCSSFLDDRGTLAEGTQQRTLAIVRTSPTNGFYVDFFRSKSTVTNRIATTLNDNVTNQYHDYIYRNIGSTNVAITTNGVTLPLVAQPNRFQNDIGDAYDQPGWRYFTNTVVSQPHDEPVRARFSVTPSGTTLYMSLIMPTVTNREYARVVSPPIVDYNSSADSPAIVVRQIGDAWNKPFAAVYEPHFSATGSTVTNVTVLWRSNIVVGLKIESAVGGQPRVHYVFSNTNATDTYSDNSIGLSFTGRFGIIADNGGGDVDLYLGQARTLSYRGNLVTAVGGTNVQAEARFAPGQPPVVVANQSVTTVVPAAPVVTLITRDAAGTVSLWATGSNGVPYSLWSRTNLTLGNWELLGGGTVLTNPFLTPHGGTSNNQSRFYQFSTP
jgi:autotransporter-associated beta strand protein